MVDTVVLYTKIYIDSTLLLDSGWDYTIKSIKGISSTRFNFKDDLILYSYFPSSGRLRLEFSVPKLLYGSNSRMVSISDIRDIHFLDGYLSFFSPDVLDDVSVSRADFCFNFQVGNSVSDYIKSFSLVNIPHMIKNVYQSDETVFWHNSRRAYRVYDKYRESEEEEAKGVLRFEVQARSPFLSDVLSSRSWHDVIDFNTAFFFLYKGLSLIDAFSLASDTDRVLSILLSRFKSSYALSLYSFYILYQEKEKDLRDILPKTCYYRYLNVFRRLGIRLSNADIDILPSLKEMFLNEFSKLLDTTLYAVV